MGFLSLIPGILQIIDKILPNKQAQDQARMELMSLIESNKYKELELDTADRISARDMYSRTKDKTVMILSWMIISSFFLFCSVLLFISIPAEMKDIIVFIAGQLSTAFLAVIYFYFGSSASSRSKDKALTDGMMNLARDADYSKEKTFTIKD